MKKLLSILLFLTVCFKGNLGFSVEVKAQEIPTNIKSSRVEYNSKSQRVVFSGKVHVTRSDFELWSETLTVQLEKTQQSGKSTAADMQAGKIDTIIAEKNVLIKSGEKEAHAEKATYTTKKDEFKLEGSPWLKEKNNTIRGQIIYHYLQSNKSVVNRGDINFSAPDQTFKK